LFRILKLDVVDALKLNLNVDLRGPTWTMLSPLSVRRRPSAYFSVLLLVFSVPNFGIEVYWMKLVMAKAWFITL